MRWTPHPVIVTTTDDVDYVRTYSDPLTFLFHYYRVGGPPGLCITIPGQQLLTGSGQSGHHPRNYELSMFWSRCESRPPLRSVENGIAMC